MLSIKPIRSATLEHRALHLCGAAAQLLLAAASEEGEITVIRLGSGDSVRLRTGRQINAMSLHPSEPVLAITGGDLGTLRVLGVDGSVVTEIPPPRVADSETKWIKPAFDGCLFTDDGQFLWCSAPLSGREIEIQLRETKGWSIVAKTIIQEPFRKSSTSFHRANGEVTTLWAASGQEGQQVFWMTHGTDWCRATAEPCLRDTVPPAFSPGGREFLVVDDGRCLCRYEYPPRTPIGSCETPDGEDDPFAEWIHYLDDHRAIAKTFNSRILLADVPNMRILDEIALAGHEPRPIEHYYPTLRGDQQLCTDISYFVCCGDTLVFVCRADRGSGLKDWRDSLLFAPLETIS